MKRNIPLYVSLFLSFYSGAVLSQSVTVLGNSADAKDCFFSAQIAIQMNNTSQSEIAACTRALTQERFDLAG